VIVSDTSTLSSFAAARALNLLFAALHVEVIYVPPAVQVELSAGIERRIAHLQQIQDLFETGRLQVVELTEDEDIFQSSLPATLGRGEREGIALAIGRGARLLTNDSRALSICRRHNIPHLNLNALLRLLWLEGVATKAKVKTLITRMSKVEGLVFKDRGEIFAEPGFFE
jgi:predicted nucleic acid-binding protein